MHLRFLSVALIVLNCVQDTRSQSHLWRRSRRANSGPSPNCKGCLVCSKDNGCLNCHPKMFLFLRREGMRQHGECLHACPTGFYGTRSPEFNICSRCRLENCDYCFSKDFCAKCKPGFYSHKGHCFDECPDGLWPSESSMDCVAGCEVGLWSEWATCARRNKTCGFKWGLETRTRHIVRTPSRASILCPTIAESRRCRMPQRHCKEGDVGKPKRKTTLGRQRVQAEKRHSQPVPTGLPVR